MNTNTITDYDIQALIDNELDHERVKKIMNYISNNKKAYQRYDELFKQKQLLKSWWQSQKKL